jgi:uncharacterized membrane protein HdeD (DUF308 family)
MNTVERPARQQSPRQELRLVMLAAVGVLGALLLAGGLAFVVGDAMDHTDEWDGLGTVIGTIAGCAGLALLVPAVAAFLLTRKHAHGAAPTTALLGVITTALALVVQGDGILKLLVAMLGLGLIATCIPVFER